MPMTMRVRRRWRPVAGALVLVVAATAWRFVSADSGAPRQRVVTPDESRARAPIFVLLYTWTAADQRIELAKDRLVTACMARYGFTYRPPPVTEIM